MATRRSSRAFPPGSAVGEARDDRLGDAPPVVSEGRTAAAHDDVGDAERDQLAQFRLDLLGATLEHPLSKLISRSAVDAGDLGQRRVGDLAADPDADTGGLRDLLRVAPVAAGVLVD